MLGCFEREAKEPELTPSDVWDQALRAAVILRTEREEDIHEVLKTLSSNLEPGCFDGDA